MRSIKNCSIYQLNLFRTVLLISICTAISQADDDMCQPQGCPTFMLAEKPNILLFLADDLGYGDLASYGHPSQQGNRIDQMAHQGLRFSQFYASDSMCTPSRAGLLTGRLPIRSGMVGGKRIMMPIDSGGLPREELTIAELLRSVGYKTGMVGKWHLGINAYNRSDGTHLPHHHGFDFVGKNLPLSNAWECDETGFFQRHGPVKATCFLYQGADLYQQPIKFETLTESLVEDWHKFLSSVQSNSKPFFFYFPFPHVHDTQFANKYSKGKTNRGLFGDNLLEMSWAVGQVLDSLKKAALDTKTLVIFTSDHGPHRELCEIGGSTGGLRGGKTNSFEGGFRTPTIAWMPGTIPKGKVSTAVLSHLDLFPTFAHLASPQQNIIPQHLKLDGIDVTKYLIGQKLDSALDLTEQRPIFFYCNQHLMAIRYREFKVHHYTSPVFETSDRNMSCPQGRPLQDWYVSQTCPDKDLIKHDPPLIFNLHIDPFELDALEPAHYKDLITVCDRLLMKHKSTVIDVPEQLGNFDARVNPCCNRPKCTCNYFDD